MVAVKTVNAKTLNIWLQKSEAILIDVRGQNEHSHAHIEGSRSIPLDQLSAHDLSAFSGKKIVLNCSSGNRSGRACEKIQAENQKLEIYSLDGGLKAWQAEGLKIIESGKIFIPLDRQVQITIGVTVLLASILGIFHSKNWLFATGFIGAGLIFAGVSGICFLATLISKMPWNKK
jgi:rhodanese-related sulfurtransferase